MISQLSDSLRPSLPAIAGALVAGLSSGASAQFGALDQDHSSARLISPTTALIAGQENTLALGFTLDREWHVYWNGQNDTGMPVSLELDTPAGWPEDWTSGALLEPVPVRHVANGDLLDHVLEGSPVMLMKIRVPESAAGSTVTIRGEASWLVCREACLLDDERLEITLPVLGPGETAAPSRDATRIANATKALPTPTGKPINWASWGWDGERLVIRTETDGTLEFYPAGDSIPIADLVTDGTTASGVLHLRMASGANEERQAVRGVVALRGEDGSVRSVWVNEVPPS